MEPNLPLCLFFALAAVANGHHFRCLQTGLFPDDHYNPKSYYLCMKDPKGLLKQGKFECSGEHTEFSAFQQKCVPKGMRFVGHYSFATVNQQPLIHREAICRRPGHRCTSCTQTVTCTGLNMKVLPSKNDTCTDGLVCEHGLGCVAQQYCTLRPFECSDEGVFPDPYDCQSYHVCQVKGGVMSHTVKTCEEEKAAFDQASETCTAHLNLEECDTPMPRCQRHFEVNPMKKNPNIFYVCVVDEMTRTIAPKFFRCPLGKSFNPPTVACE